MGLSRTVSEIDDDFRRKSQNFPNPCILRPRWRGSPSNWASAHGIKKLKWWSYRAEKKVWQYLQASATIHQRDRQTDRRTVRRTDTGRQQRPRLRIASCGKNVAFNSINNDDNAQGAHELQWRMLSCALISALLDFYYLCKNMRYIEWWHFQWPWRTAFSTTFDRKLRLEMSRYEATSLVTRIENCVASSCMYLVCGKTTPAKRG